METFFKTFAVISILFFGYAITVQFNDPDAIKWILIYLVAAVASILFLLKKLKPVVYFLLTIFFVVLFFMYWPENYEGVRLGQGMKTVNIEEGRESLGLLIVAIVMLVYGLRASFPNKSKV